MAYGMTERTPASPHWRGGEWGGHPGSVGRGLARRPGRSGSSMKAGNAYGPRATSGTIPIPPLRSTMSAAHPMPRTGATPLPGRRRREFRPPATSATNRRSTATCTLLDRRARRHHHGRRQRLLGRGRGRADPTTPLAIADVVVIGLRRRGSGAGVPRGGGAGRPGHAAGRRSHRLRKDRLAPRCRRQSRLVTSVMPTLAQHKVSRRALIGRRTGRLGRHRPAAGGRLGVPGGGMVILLRSP